MVIGDGEDIGGVVGDGKYVGGVGLLLFIGFQGGVQIPRLGVVEQVVPDLIDGVEAGAAGGKEAGIAVGDAILVADEGES